MLGRKSYTRKEIDRARTAVDQQLAAYKKLVKTVNGATTDPKVATALAAFEPLFLDSMTLALDRYFVHRIRAVTGKDGNPLNEVELLSESLIDDGVLKANNVIKLVPEESITKIPYGEQMRLGVAQFERLAKAFFAELEARFA